MRRVFADTHFYLATLSRRDFDHEKAVRIFREGRFTEVVTTLAVLFELADGMRGIHERQRCVRFIEQLRASAKTKIIALSPSLIDRSFALYRARPDKEWSLTDCISFIVMEDEGLADALTHDHHFHQAGYVALLAQS